MTKKFTLTRKLLIFFIISSLLLSSMLTGCTTSSAENLNLLQGNLEAEDVDINTKIPGKILTIEVEEGQYIEKDDVIATIDAKDLAAKREGLVAQANAALAAVDIAKAQQQAAEGQLEAAKALLSKAQNGARSEDIQKAQANYDIMKKSYDRILALYEEGAVALAQLDEIETKLKVAEQDLSIAKSGARAEDIEAAKGQVAAAQGQVAAAQGSVIAANEKYTQAAAGITEVDTYITDAAIRSPLSGYVTSLNCSAGEMLSTGMNLATITNLDKITLTVNADETLLPKFKENQAVKVSVLSYKDEEFNGKIVQINKKPDFAIKKASNENGDFDLITYGIKIEIENKDQKLRPGMTAFINIEE